MKRMIRLLLVLLVPSLCFGLENNLAREAVDTTVAAEVEPGTFVDCREHLEKWVLKHTSFTAVHLLSTPKPAFYQRDTTYLSISWQGREVLWVGLGVPICLRSRNNLLYLVVFDRESDAGRIRFRYFRQDHGVMAEMAATDFPKEIAVQNLWLKKENGFRDGTPINEVEIAKSLDPENIDFQQSLTAKIWMQLETGKEFYEIKDTPADAGFLKEFKEKYGVKKLPTILKE